MNEVQVREVPEMALTTEQGHVVQAELQAWLQGAMARTAKTAEDLGGIAGTSEWSFLQRDSWPNEPVFVVVYFGNPNDGPAEILVGTPLTDRALASRPDVTVVPAHREAYLRVRKETVVSGRIGGIYEQIEQWIQTQGLEAIDAPREVYWTDFFGAAPEAEVFDVAWPIR
jgi:hypothetical protein